MYIETIGELACAGVDRLKYKLGEMGETLWRYANGLDDSPVKFTGESDPVKSIGNGRTFRRDLISRGDIRTALTALSDMVSARMRKANVKCNSVQVTIKNTGLKSITRQKGTGSPTWLAADLYREALHLIQASWPREKPIRMLTITAQKLEPADGAAGQLSLFESERKEKERQERLEAAVGGIRGKYGSGSISHANLVKNDLGLGEESSLDGDPPDTD
jgi:DNA polymerase-4